MSSETITRNDLTAVLNEVLPPTPSEYKKLLWTNTQGGQTSYTITANFSNYDVIEVEFNRDGCIYSFTMANSGSATFRFPYGGYFVVRTATISGTTMTIGNGGYYSTYNNSTVTDGAIYAVPTKIYGIKYDRVAPPQVEDDSGWLDISTDIGKYRRKNGYVTVDVNKSMSVTGSWVTIGSVPEGFRPVGSGGVYFAGIPSSDTGIQLYVSPNNGDIQVKAVGTTGTFPVYGTITYPVD